MADVPEGPYTVGVYWSFAIDRHDLGVFTEVSGLKVDVDVKTVVEGGNNSFEWKLPTRMKYGNIKLSRPVTAAGTAAITTWLASMTGKVERTQAKLTALSSSGEEIATWTFQEVIPLSWSGPQLSSESAKVLSESVEFAHHGFLPNVTGMSA